MPDSPDALKTPQEYREAAAAHISNADQWVTKAFESVHEASSRHSIEARVREHDRVLSELRHARESIELAMLDVSIACAGERALRLLEETTG